MRPLLPFRRLTRRRGAAVFGIMVLIAVLAGVGILGMFLLWGQPGSDGGAEGPGGGDEEAVSGAPSEVEGASAPGQGGLEGLVGGGAFLVLEGEGTGIDALNGVSPGPRRILTLRNAGDAASPPLGAAVVLEGPEAGSFTVTPIGCGVLAPRAGCAIEVRAVRSENGAFSARLRVAARNQPTLALSGTATGFGAPLAWEGSGAGIDTAAPGPSPFRILQLRNLSPSPVSAVVSVVGGPFRIAASTCAAPVAGGAACQVAVEAAPAADGPYQGTLLAATPGGTVSLALSGEASGFVPALAWQGSGAGFAPVAPPVPAVTAWRTVSLVNQGAVRTPSAPIFSLSGPAAGSFEVDAAGCAGVLDPQTSCTVQVRASRAVPGAFSATLSAAVGGVSADLPLSGAATGFVASLAWESPGAVPPITSPSGLPSLGAPATWRLRNVGTLETSPLAGQVVLGGVSPGNFEIVRNTCAAPLAPGAACEVDVRLVASASGTYQALLGVGAHNAPGTPLAGTAAGFAAILAWSGPTTGYDILSPTTTPFEGTAQSVVLTNVGWATSSDLTGSVALGGARPDAFRIVSDGCIQALPPGQSCTVQVAPRASDNLGEVTAQLVMQAATAPAHPLAGAIGGFVAFWAFDAAPAGAFSIDAPAASPATQTQTFVLRNVGTLAGAAPTPGISGPTAADFSITGGTCAGQSLAPGATCTVQVTFSAADNVSGRRATLAAAGATKALTGSASGFAPALSWTVLPPAFSMNASKGGVTQPATAAPGPVGTAELRNTGTLASGPVSLALSGADAAAFEIVPGQDGCSGQFLAPGATCTLSVRLVAGLLPADYGLQLSATAPSLAPVASVVSAQRVVGPRRRRSAGSGPAWASSSSPSTTRPRRPSPASGRAACRPTPRRAGAATRSGSATSTTPPRACCRPAAWRCITWASRSPGV